MNCKLKKQFTICFNNLITIFLINILLKHENERNDVFTKRKIFDF